MCKQSLFLHMDSNFDEVTAGIRCHIIDMAITRSLLTITQMDFESSGKHNVYSVFTTLMVKFVWFS